MRYPSTDAERLSGTAAGTTPDNGSAYVGKRRAQAAAAAEELLTTYIGRRVAHPENLNDPNSPSTGELEALLEIPMDDTAPRPRVSMDVAWTPRITEQPRPTRPLFVPAARDALTDSSIHLPAVTLASAYALDLAPDTTTTLTSIGGGRRRAKLAGTRRRFPLPAALGVAAVAAAIVGTTMTAPADANARFQAEWRASATGSSDVGAVGVRSLPTSRASSRQAASVDSAAVAREKALASTSLQAQGWDKQLSNNTWVTPIAQGSYELTGRFGQYSGLWATFHTGLDFACGYGTPIHAVATGVITSASWGGAYGNLTQETLADGTVLYYAHQSSFGVSVGERVTKDQIIGYVGATGNVTGPHVHLEVRPGGGDPVDPQEALQLHGVTP